MLDAKPGRDLVIPAVEARALRDEISKLLADKVDTQSQPEVIEVQVKGGGW